MLANFVKQISSTVGTGSILLDGTVDGFVSFVSRYPDNSNLIYTIEEGNNREIGIGIYNSGPNTITRSHILENNINGVFNKPGISAMDLSGSAIISVAPTSQANIYNEPIWKSKEAVLDPTNYSPAPTKADILNGIYEYSFSGSIVESLGFKINLGNDIQQNTDMILNLNWSPSDSLFGNVKWGVTYAIANNVTGIIDTAIIDTAIQPVSGTGNKLQYVTLPLSISSDLPNSVIIGKVYRMGNDAADTYTQNAFLHSVYLNYYSNAKGTPSRTNDFYNWS